MKDNEAQPQTTADLSEWSARDAIVEHITELDRLVRDSLGNKLADDLQRVIASTFKNYIPRLPKRQNRSRRTKAVPEIESNDHE